LVLPLVWLLLLLWCPPRALGVLRSIRPGAGAPLLHQHARAADMHLCTASCVCAELRGVARHRAALLLLLLLLLLC
jgi:hypothetical protein